MIREVEDGLGKISLRTEAPYDAAQICQVCSAAAAMPRRREPASRAASRARKQPFCRRCADSGVKL
ncbi:MAG: hypothetical protein ACLUN5_17905 [Oscillospiraceae bacterium]